MRPQSSGSDWQQVLGDVPEARLMSLDSFVGSAGTATMRGWLSPAPAPGVAAIPSQHRVCSAFVVLPATDHCIFVLATPTVATMATATAVDVHASNFRLLRPTHGPQRLATLQVERCILSHLVATIPHSVGALDLSINPLPSFPSDSMSCPISLS